jgi:RHS repeat-associated protein
VERECRHIGCFEGRAVITMRNISTIIIAAIALLAACGQPPTIISIAAPATDEQAIQYAIGAAICATTANNENSILDVGEVCDNGASAGCTHTAGSRCIVAGFQCSQAIGVPSVCVPLNTVVTTTNNRNNDGKWETGEVCDNGGLPGCAETPNSAVKAKGFDCINTTGLPSLCTPICGDGFDAGLLNDTAREECDVGNNFGPGCAEDVQKRCQIVPGWSCTLATATGPSTCTNSTCGNGTILAPEVCDDGVNNSNTRPNACRSDCRRAGCGDGIVDWDPNNDNVFTDGEACDDGIHNDEPGMCNHLCTARLPYETFALVENNRVTMAPGTNLIGIVINQSEVTEITTAATVDLVGYGNVVDAIFGSDLVTGITRYVDVANSDYKIDGPVTVTNPVIIYNEGSTLNSGAAFHFDNYAVDVWQGTFVVSPGSLMVGPMAAFVGGSGTCCGGGGADLLRGCAVTMGGTPFPGPTPEPCYYGQCDPNTVPGITGITKPPLPSVMTDPFLTISAATTFGFECGQSCAVAGGQTTLCAEPNGPPSLPALPITRNCGPGSRAGNLGIDICGYVSGFSNCPGSCRQGVDCWTLAPGDSYDDPTPIGGDCAVQLSCNYDDQLSCCAPPPAVPASTQMIDQWRDCLHGSPNCPATGLFRPFGRPDLTVATFCDRRDRCSMCSSSTGACIPFQRTPQTISLQPKEVDNAWLLTKIAPDTSTPSQAEMMTRLRRKLGQQTGDGDPIAVGNGELMLESTDVSFDAHPFDMALSRSYRSASSYSGSFGPGWSHNFEEHIELIGDPLNRADVPTYCVANLPTPTCVYHHDGAGGRTLYEFEPGTGKYVPANGALGVLSASETAMSIAGMAADPNAPLSVGWTLRLPGGTEKSFDLFSGVLLSITDERGRGIGLKWRSRTNAATSLEGSMWDVKMVRGSDGRNLKGSLTAAWGGDRTRMSFLNTLVLDEVVDGFGRRMAFEYQTFSHATDDVTCQHPNAACSGVTALPKRRLRLKQIKVHKSDINNTPATVVVKYDYKVSAVTKEAYLNKVTRFGLAAGVSGSTTLATTSDTITEYETAASLFESGGVYTWTGTNFSRTYSSALGIAVHAEVAAVETGLATCSGAPGMPGMDPDLGNEGCSNANQFEAGADVGAAPDYWTLIEEQLSNNIVRVTRDGELELETFYEVDPRRGDFDRAVKQRYGLFNDATGLGTTESREGTVVFNWQSNMREYRQYSAVGYDGTNALATGSGYNSIPNPFLQRSWWTAGLSVPTELTSALPIVTYAYLSTGTMTPPTACNGLREHKRLPAFEQLDAVTSRIDGLSTLARTATHCSSIAAKYERDALLMDILDSSDIIDGITVATFDRRAEILKDSNVVCEWVQSRGRKGRDITFGLNFRGETIAQADPSPTGTGNVVTLWRRNADGVVLDEKRPDGSRTVFTYDEGAGGQVVHALTRGNVLSIVEIPAPATLTLPAANTEVLAGTTTAITNRTWSFTYEPFFQQISTVTSPSGRLSNLYYEYQQQPFGIGVAGADSETTRERFQRLTSYGGGSYGDPFFLNSNLDGDAVASAVGETGANLVLEVQKAVDVGGGLTRDVGTRYRLDNFGRVTAQTKVVVWNDPSQDTDLQTITYYDDFDDALTGTATTSVDAGGLGPVKEVINYRIKPTDVGYVTADADVVSYRYDILGSVRQVIENGQTDSIVNTLRNEMGQTASILEPGRTTTFTYNSRGRLEKTQVNAPASPALGTMSTVIAYGLGGGEIGRCKPVAVASACDTFQADATVMVEADRAGNVPTLPTSLTGAEYSVTLFDAEDVPVGSMDAGGGYRKSTISNAGLVTALVVRGSVTPDAQNPDSHQRFSYDNMGRMLRRAIGTSTTDLRESFYRYDTLGRLIGSEDLAPLTETAFSTAQGTVENLAYNIEDEVVARRLIGDAGTTALVADRKMLAMERVEYNIAGAPRFVHRYAGPQVVSTSATFNKTATSTNPSSVFSEAAFTGDTFASSETRYDHALRTVRELTEGLDGTTYTFDGFGMSSADSLAERTDILINPTSTARTTWPGVTGGGTTSARMANIKRQAKAQGANAVTRSSFEKRQVDHRGLMTSSSQTDAANSIARTTTMTYDDLHRMTSSTDPTGRGSKRYFDAQSGRLVRSEQWQSQLERYQLFSYDTMGRLAGETSYDGQTNAALAPPKAITYDPAGRVFKEELGGAYVDSRTIWKVDAAGRLESHTRERPYQTNTRTYGYFYGANAGKPNLLTAGLAISDPKIRVWARDGAQRAKTAQDMNYVAASDTPGDANFPTTRPKLTSVMNYDSLGRMLTDELKGDTFAAIGNPNANTFSLALKTVTRPVTTYAGPSAAGFKSTERLLFTYLANGLVNTQQRQTAAAGSIRGMSFQYEGGLWVRGTTTDAATLKGTLTKVRDGFGMIMDSDVTNTSSVFREQVLRGPTGRIVATRTRGTLYAAAAPATLKGRAPQMRSFQYDALSRLSGYRVDADTATTETTFATLNNNAINNETYNPLPVAGAGDAAVTLTRTKNETLLSATADEFGRVYASIEDATWSGVPQSSVNGYTMNRDSQDRILSGGTGVAGTGALTFTHDALDRLVRVQRGSLEEMRIAYDGLGRRRLERKAMGVGAGPGFLPTSTIDVTLEYWANNVVEETTTVTTGTPVPVMLSAHAPSSLDAPLWLSVGRTNAALANHYTLATTARGDVAAAIQASLTGAASVLEEQHLDPYGEKEVVKRTATANQYSTCVQGKEANNQSHPQQTCTTVVVGRYGLAGGREHERTKLVDFRNRVYATHLKGFTSKDPMGNVDSDGLFNYAAGDPVNLRDPWGLDAIDDGLGTGGEIGSNTPLNDPDLPGLCEPDAGTMDFNCSGPSAAEVNKQLNDIDKATDKGDEAAKKAAEEEERKRKEAEKKAEEEAAKKKAEEDDDKDLCPSNLFCKFLMLSFADHRMLTPEYFPAPPIGPPPTGEPSPTWWKYAAAVSWGLEFAMTRYPGRTGGGCIGGRCGGVSCFPPGTMVLLADGTTKPIEAIVEGDWVIANDPGASDGSVARRVLKVLQSNTESLVRVTVDADADGTDDGYVDATSRHPFWTGGGWVAARDLLAGDILADEAGGRVVVLSIALMSTPSVTYNLTVEDVHTFFVMANATAVLVHNSGTSTSENPAEGWTTVTRQMNEQEAPLWDANRGTMPQPQDDRTYVIRPGGPPGGGNSNPVTIQFDVPTSALAPASKPGWAQVFNQGRAIPIRNVQRKACP